MKGTIRVRENADGSKRYVCQVFAGRDPRSGKKRYVTGTATSEREAHRLIHRLVGEVESGTAVRDKATVNELIAAWLETAGPAGEYTRSVYAGFIRNHIEGGIGRISVAKLRVEDLDLWYIELREKGLAPSSIRKCHNVVRGALTHGVRWGWIPSNIAVHASPPRVPKPVVKTPDPATVTKLIDFAENADPEMAVYIRLAAVTGARPGEMCGLRWDDLDTDAGELDIRRRVVKTSPEATVQDLTKTGKTRQIPLDAGTIDVLTTHRRICEERAADAGTSIEQSGYIFSDSMDSSTFWRTDSTSRRFRWICDKSGVEGIPLYGLRHQAATTLIDKGVDAKTVSDRLGNSVTTVLSTYTRARTSADRSAADLMGKMFD